MTRAETAILAALDIAGYGAAVVVIVLGVLSCLPVEWLWWIA